MSSPLSKTSVAFAPEPYTLCPVQGFQTVWKCYSWGVYLWCIEYHGDYLVYYVGKTWNKTWGFSGRLWQEVEDWRKKLGHGPPFDMNYFTPLNVDAYKEGKRVRLENLTDDELCRQLHRQHKELMPLYRVFLAPIEEKGDIIRVENEIVYRLREQGGAVFDFLSNKDKDTKYPHEPAVGIISSGNRRIIGLTAPIPPPLR